MRRFSAHYIALPISNIHKLHYIELDDQMQFKSINPLTNEIADTSFYNGALLVVNTTAFSSYKELSTICECFLEQFPEATLSEFMDHLRLDEIIDSASVAVYHLDRIDLLSTKFRANDSRSNSHIQRLC